MKMNLISVFLIFFITACTEQTKKSLVLIPVEERNRSAIIDNIPTAKSKEKVVINKQLSVIIVLLEDANRLFRQGQNTEAAAMIERALRIEPRNGLLWHHLSKVRFQQQQWKQAIAMAKKSNVLLKSNRNMKLENWALIATAYEKLGNNRKANEVRNKYSNQN
jgi:tetratricopeptide (TPR) repeat protein